MTAKKKIICPSCGRIIHKYKNPIPTVDVIIEFESKIVLIERKNIPYGWALPGGFVDYGEIVEEAAVREAKEETDLDVKLYHLLGVYSDPERDLRMHTITTAFVGRGTGIPKAADDAKDIDFFNKNSLPSPIVFDHSQILNDYFQWRN